MVWQKYDPNHLPKYNNFSIYLQTTQFVNRLNYYMLNGKLLNEISTSPWVLLEATNASWDSGYRGNEILIDHLLS